MEKWVAPVWIHGTWFEVLFSWIWCFYKVGRDLPVCSVLHSTAPIPQRLHLKRKQNEPEKQHEKYWIHEMIWVCVQFDFRLEVSDSGWTTTTLLFSPHKHNHKRPPIPNISDAVFVLGDQVSVSGFGFVEVIADDDEVELASDELKSRLSLPSIHYLGADFLPKRRITRQSDES